MINLDPLTHIESDYLHTCFADLSRKIAQAVTTLAPHESRFEGIAVRGTSGLLVGPMVAATVGKPWCVVRKPGDGTHSDHKTVEGWFGFRTYIIIDDLTATGSTIRLIQKEIRDHAVARGREIVPSCVGFYLYNHDEAKWRGDLRGFDSIYEKYFLYPENFKRPTVSEQIATAVAARPVAGYLTY